jgi:hypothetical protein
LSGTCRDCTQQQDVRQRLDIQDTFPSLVSFRAASALAEGPNDLQLAQSPLLLHRLISAQEPWKCSQIISPQDVQQCLIGMGAAFLNNIIPCPVSPKLDGQGKFLDSV